MTFVYRYYDQAELERQLNARVRDFGMPGTSHFDIVFGLADPQSPLAQASIETMGHG